jgi:hypothetical protein
LSMMPYCTASSGLKYLVRALSLSTSASALPQD